MITPATMRASTTAEAMVHAAMTTTPHAMVATRKRRIAADARHSRGSSGARAVGQDSCLGSPMEAGIRSAEIR